MKWKIGKWCELYLLTNFLNVATCALRQWVNQTIGCHRLSVKQNNHHNLITPALVASARRRGRCLSLKCWTPISKEDGVRHEFTPCWAALQPVLDWDSVRQTDRNMGERERSCDGRRSCSSRLHHGRETWLLYYMTMAWTARAVGAAVCGVILCGSVIHDVIFLRRQNN